MIYVILFSILAAAAIAFFLNNMNKAANEELKTQDEVYSDKCDCTDCKCEDELAEKDYDCNCEDCKCNKEEPIKVEEIIFAPVEEVKEIQVKAVLFPDELTGHSGYGDSTPSASASGYSEIKVEKPTKKSKKQPIKKETKKAPKITKVTKAPAIKAKPQTKKKK